MESQAVCNLGDRLVCAGQEVLGQVYYLSLYELLRRPSGFFFHEVAEVVGRKEAPFGEVFHRRQPLALGPVAPEVDVELVLKAREHVVVGFAAGDELPVVEPHAIVEQQLYVAAYQRFAVLVDGTSEFHLNLVEAVGEYLFLVVRQVQRLARGVVEKRILPYALSERRAPYEVGVEQQPAGVGFEVRHALYVHHLSRGEAGDGALLVVVGLPAVGDVAAVCLL